MTWLRKLPDSLAAIKGIGATRQIRYAAVALAIAGLVWSCCVFLEIRHSDEAARIKTLELRKAVADLRTQVMRQRPVRSAKLVDMPDEEATADAAIF